jgi:HD-GYP domain-containing protein (c-di-GMP phosphodiesterase class II)
MRFVPASCLREGMRIAKTLYGINSEKLLAEGVILNRILIGSIRRLSFPGVYIDDNLSQDIEIINTISDELRIETMHGIKKIFLEAGESKDPRERTEDISKQVDGILDELLANKNMMVNMIDLKCFDNYTYLHSVNVAVLAIVTGIALNLDRVSLWRLGLSAILHDIGKVFIDKRIINKPGVLTDSEFDIMKRHSLLGYTYAKEKFSLPGPSYFGILDHHEKFDGQGYPKGKAGTNISVFGRIITVSDIYDALTSERPYRKALSPSEAMEYIMGNAATMFDPQIAGTFIRKVAPYPIGTTVKLSNGCTAIVLENFESYCLRPRVRVYRINDRDVEPFELNLMEDFSLLNVVVEDVANEENNLIC